MIDKSLLKHCISVDVETTSIDPEEGSIVSVGACFFEGNETFYKENYLRSSHVEIKDGALAVNGYSREELINRKMSDYPSEIEVYQQLVDFAKGYDAKIIVGKNPNFDLSFLNAIAYRNLEKRYFSYRLIDWSNFAALLMLKQGIEITNDALSSDAVAKFLELPEEPKPHNALTGAQHNVTCFWQAVKKLGL